MRSFSQIYIMTVFGVKYRLGLIDPAWEKELHAVIAQTLKKIDGVMPIEVGGFKDHIHMLYSSRGKVSDISIMSVIKTESSKWINRIRLCIGRFGWQDGCGLFSYSKGQLQHVQNYIRNQAVHHKTISYLEEFQFLVDRSGEQISDHTLPEELL